MTEIIVAQVYIRTLDAVALVLSCVARFEKIVAALRA
jgi:hypothetical protein